MTNKRYNFDETIVRRGSNCYKWDTAEEEDVIPMWVADMDFRVADPIIEALQKRVNHGVFGYTKVPEAYYDSIISWFARRHNFHIEREWIEYTTGVVPAVSVVIKALTNPGDKVLMQTPIYNCFFSSIKNNDCIVEESLLKQDANGDWHVDFDDFERKCSDERVKIFLLCNPHNPVGRVWTKDELRQMNDVCMRHGVIVLSDEIHCELVMPGYEYTPFAAISEETLGNSITCSSPSKSFNIAGLQIANIVTNNPEWREKIDRAININEVCDVNPFGPVALMAAYNDSEDWLDQLNLYIYDNYKALCSHFEQHLPDLKISRLEGTYLAWIDIRPTGQASDNLTDLLMKQTHVQVNSGTMYGTKAGEGFIRLNLACPRSQLNEALKRITPTLASFH